MKAAVALAAVLPLWGVLAFYEFENAYQQQYRDPYMIAAQVERFGGLAGVVPENARLGYLTDAAPGSTAALAMLNGAQYALAPRILQQGAAEPLVLGNFTRPLDYQGIGRQHGLRMDRDLGNGVVLFRKEGK